MKLTEKLSLIDELQNEISSLGVDKNKLFEPLVQVCKQITASDRASLFLYNDETKLIVSEVAQGLSEKIYIELGEGLVGKCALSKEPIIESNVDDSQSFNSDIDMTSGYITCNTLTLPILGEDDNLLGVIQLLNKELGNYDSMDVKLLSSIASLAAKYI